jgi:hypothetical protein
MKIVVELSVRTSASAALLGSFMRLAFEIDSLAGVSTIGTLKPAASVTDLDQALPGAAEDGGGENEGEEGEGEEGDEVITGLAPPGTGAVAPKKRGRKPKNAEQALAGMQAGNAASTAVTPAALPPGVSPMISGAAPSGAPPGVGGAAAGVGSPPGVAPVAAAVPAQTPAPPLAEGQFMTVDDFKTQAMAIHSEAQKINKATAYPFNIIRAENWPDGSAKAWKTMTMDTVPAEDRQRVLDWSMYNLAN